MLIALPDALLALSWSCPGHCYLLQQREFHATAASHLEVIAGLVVFKLYVQALLYANLRCSKTSEAAAQGRQSDNQMQHMNIATRQVCTAAAFTNDSWQLSAAGHMLCCRVIEVNMTAFVMLLLLLL
jgi:hypothetical protein